MFLRQSTAATVEIGPYVDSTDGATSESGLTISQADIRLSKNGGAFAQKNDATAATHMENGFFSVPLDATDTDTVGRLRVASLESGALHVWHVYFVLPAAVYDWLTGTTTTLPGVGAAGASLSAIPWNAAWDSEVESEATDALNAYDPPTRAELTSDINSILTAVGAVDDFVDTEIAAIKAVVDAIKLITDQLTFTGTNVNAEMKVAATNSITDLSLDSTAEASLANTLLDLANALEAGVSLRGGLRLILANAAGDLTGAGTGTEVIRAAVTSAKARITATANPSTGERTITATDMT